MEAQKSLKSPLFYKSYLKPFLKIALTGLALFLVFGKLDLQEVGQILRSANYMWLIPSLFLLLLSKVVSAFRMDFLLHCIGLPLGKWYNIQLCFIGMYYSLFLPGGIGGDGYKVFFLRKKYSVPLRSLLSATLLDRLSGVVALVALVLILIPASSIFISGKYMFLVVMGWVLLYPLFYLLLKSFFPAFLSAFWQMNGYSLIVQGMQIVCIITILLSLSVEGFFLDYIVLFLLSSLAAMLPVTIGGAGAREAVFLFLPGMLKMPVDTAQGVTVSLLFLLITVVSSLPGAFIPLQEKQVGLEDSCTGKQ